MTQTASLVMVQEMTWCTGHVDAHMIGHKTTMLLGSELRGSEVTRSKGSKAVTHLCRVGMSGLTE